MKKLTLNNHVQGTATVLDNEFIDRYMVKANGEYVKVYLILLRHLNNHAPSSLTICGIADMLEVTEKDVIRALNYWKNQGLLDYETSDDKAPDRKEISSDPSPDRPARQPADTIVSGSSANAKGEASADVPNIQQYRSRKERQEFRELMYVAEQYLGKTLSGTDIDAITYFYDGLHMSADLIEYLIEYCVDNGHKSIHYIRKVAQSWTDQKIATVEQAKACTVLYNKNCYSVLNAYGLKGRAPSASETAFIKRWNEEYCFSLDIILEACNRTMNTIHQPNFEYTDTILKSWLGKDVHSLADIKALDDVYRREREQRKKSVPKPCAPANKFNNFEGRSYDMDDLERQLLQQ